MLAEVVEPTIDPPTKATESCISTNYYLDKKLLNSELYTLNTTVLHPFIRNVPATIFTQTTNPILVAHNEELIGMLHHITCYHTFKQYFASIDAKSQIRANLKGCPKFNSKTSGKYTRQLQPGSERSTVDLNMGLGVGKTQASRLDDPNHQLHSS